MFRSSLPIILAFVCLLVPAGLLAWFHYAYFPAVLTGTQHLWGTQKPLPVGFDLLCRFGFMAYVPLPFIAVAAILSWRFPAFRGALCLGFCGGVLAVICVVYATFLSTPALAHGLTM